MNGNIVKKALTASTQAPQVGPTPNGGQIAAQTLAAQLSSLRNENCAIQDEIVELITKLGQIKCEIAATEQLLSIDKAPITRMPQDILELIFLETVFNEGDWPNERLGIPVSQVCSTWRSISTEQPKLWSKFTYHIDRTLTGSQNDDLDDPQKLLAMCSERLRARLDMWFRRSRPLKVSLCIKDSQHNWLVQKWILQTVIHEAFEVHRARISTLRLDGGCDEVILMAGMYLKSVTHFELNNAKDWTLEAFKYPSDLRSIKYNISTHSPFDHPVPWHQLTDIDMSETTVPTSVMLWQALAYCCSRLRIGRFSLASDSFWSHSVLRSIPAGAQRAFSSPEQHRLPDLHTLAFTFRDGRVPLLKLLQKLALPRLSHLELRYNVGASPTAETVSSWREPLARLASLRDLTISGVAYADLSVLRECLAQLTLLTSLKLHIQSDSKLFQMLTIYPPPPAQSSAFHPEIPSQSTVLPSLERLSLWIWNMHPAEKRDFWLMVRSRQSHSAAGSTDLQEESTPFILDAYIDKTKTYGDTNYVQTLQESDEYQRSIPCVNFHLAYPYTTMY